MERGEGDDYNNTNVYIYNGVDEVPVDVTQVRVESSVTIIPERAFMNRHELEKIKLPEGLITIEKQAFDNCTSLKRVNLPTTVEEIGFEAFNTCGKLEEIVLPEGLRRLGKWAFYECKSLRTINIPPGIQTFGRSAFWQCCGLLEVYISEGVQEIRGGAFDNCKSLVSVNFPSSLKVIEEAAFIGCKGLNEVHFPDTVEAIKRHAFYCCNLQSFRVPPLLLEVDMRIIDGNKCLVSLEVSENVTTLKEFYGNIDLNSLRNIAFPSCTVMEGAKCIWGGCNDLEVAFPNENEEDDEISNALKHRFDDLPIHKICYYQSYHPTETVMQNLKREINPWTANILGQLNASGKEQDCLGMTPLHILACSTQQNVEMYRLMIEKYPEALIMKDKWGIYPSCMQFGAILPWMSFNC